jgi:NADH:ubiquinone oxidoreductase subunit 3 (subunit A)
MGDDEWCCDKCEKEFPTKEEATEHEKTCSYEEKTVLESESGPSLLPDFEETITMNEAMSYGFNFFGYMSAFLFIIFIIEVVGYNIYSESTSKIGEIFGLLVMVFSVILLISLSIAIRYKTWVDILGRARKEE